MAKCKICGNYVADEMYNLNNGMCDLCVRTAQGDDDLIVEIPVETQVNPRAQEILARRAKEEEKYTFNCKNFEGKSIREYTFPDFIASKVVSGEGFATSEALLLTTHLGITAFEIVISIIIGFFLLPFVGVGVYFTGMQIYDLVCYFLGTGARDLGNILPMLAFICVWDTMVYLFVYALILKSLFIYDWVLLKNDGIECYSGHSFKSKKAKKYKFQDLDVQLAIESGNKTVSYYVDFTDRHDHSFFHKKKFRLKVSMDREGRYWVDFLRWFQSRSYGG